MKKILLSVSLAAFALMVGSLAMAAGSQGTADEAQSRAAPSKKMTKEEKAAARAARKASGKEMKKGAPGAATEAMNRPKGTAKAATKEEKAAAKAERKAGAAAALKAGEIPSGDKPIPEPKK
jgi:hypothetical protein